MSNHNEEQIIPHPEDGYEKRDAVVWRIAVVGVASVVIVALLVVAAKELFVSMREEIVYEAALKPESPQLRELRARETERLTTYGVVDSAQGIYRIPIERAMELAAREGYENRSKQVSK